MDIQLESLLDAARILDAKRHEVCNEPQPVYNVVFHAMNYINCQLDVAMRGIDGEN